MPLLRSPSANAFVQITDIYIDSEQDKGSSDQTNYNFTVQLPNQISNVIGVEVPEYHAPFNIASQFTGANKIDFRLRNPSVNGGNWKTLVATLPTEKQIYLTPERNPGCVCTNLYGIFALTILKDPDFGGVCDILPIPQPDEKILFLCRTLVYPPAATWPGMGSTECELLFGTGANLATSAGPVLGFDVQDYTMTNLTIDGQLFKHVFSDRPVNTSRFTNISLSFDETPELNPILRVFHRDRISALRPQQHAHTRLLTEPIRDLRRLTCRVRIGDGTEPTRDEPIFFTVRVFSLNLTHKIPYYAKNRICIR
jgi:hypothetical protein